MIRPADTLHLALRAITAHRLRSFLTLLGIAVGIAAVILLTSIGEGIHRFVLAEFTQFGTNVIGIGPGKTKTSAAPLRHSHWYAADAGRCRQPQDAAACDGGHADGMGQHRSRRQRPPAPHHGLWRQRGDDPGVQHQGTNGPSSCRRTIPTMRAPSSCSGRN